MHYAKLINCLAPDAQNSACYTKLQFPSHSKQIHFQLQSLVACEQRKKPSITTKDENIYCQTALFVYVEDCISRHQTPTLKMRKRKEIKNVYVKKK